MNFLPSSPSSWFNLPRSGGIAYAAQEPWIENTTIRANILFGETYDEQRYSKGGWETLLHCAWAHTVPVIEQCGLVSDFASLTTGDLTEVGERGLTLRFGPSTTPEHILC